MQTLVDLLTCRAAEHPDRTAFTFLPDGEQEEPITYGGLDRRAREIGARLQAMGAAGERAILLYHPGLEYIAAFFGCLYAGVVAVPAYPPRNNRNLDRLQAIVLDAGSKFVLTTASIAVMAERTLTEATGLQGITWVATDGILGGAADWHQPQIAGQTLGFLQYTSGSTGDPKGVMVGHANLLHNLGAVTTAMELTADSVVVSWLPPFHDMGLIGGLLGPLYVGGHCIFMPPAAFLVKPLRWLRAITTYQGTVSGGPGFAYDLCTRKINPEELPALDLQSWKVAFNGAEPVRADILERFTRTFAPCGFRWKSFYPCYGLAEATLFVSGGRPDAPPVLSSVGQATLVGCGVRVPDQQVRIVDPDHLTPVPPGQVGEVWLSGPSVAGGYWNRPDATAETFGARLADTGEGPFLRTGDLGFCDENGELFITGRLKDVIILRGRNLYPQDLEQTVEQSHPSLLPACGAAFGLTLDGDEQLVIVQEVHRHERDFEPIFRAIRQAVTEQHDVRIHAIALVKQGSVPKTSSGKIQRRACRALYQSGRLDVVAEAGARPLAAREG